MKPNEFINETDTSSIATAPSGKSGPSGPAGSLFGGPQKRVEENVVGGERPKETKKENDRVTAALRKKHMVKKPVEKKQVKEGFYSKGWEQYYESADEFAAEIFEFIDRKFGGKAWFKGGSYAYMIDTSKPNQLVASDGSPIKVANIVNGLEDYCDQGYLDDFVNSDPSYWDEYFRPVKSQPRNNQADHETANMQGESTVNELSPATHRRYVDKVAQAGIPGDDNPFKGRTAKKNYNTIHKGLPKALDKVLPQRAGLGEGRNHLCCKFEKDGKKFHLWNDGEYQYSLTANMGMDGPKRVHHWPDADLERVKAELEQRGYTDLTHELGEGAGDNGGFTGKGWYWMAPDKVAIRSARKSDLQKSDELGEGYYIAYLDDMGHEVKRHSSMQTESQLNEYKPKLVPTHLGSGKPNPNHPHFEKHKAEYDNKRAMDKAAAKAARPAPAPKAQNREKQKDRFRAKYDKIRAKLGSPRPTNPLEKKARDAMLQVWHAIAPDAMAALKYPGYSVEDEMQIEDPFYIAEICTDANRMMEWGGLSREEEREILVALSSKTLARLASDFGY